MLPWTVTSEGNLYVLNVFSLCCWKMFETCQQSPVEMALPTFLPHNILKLKPIEVIKCR